MILFDDVVEIMASRKGGAKPHGGRNVGGSWVVREVRCRVGGESDDADSLAVKRKSDVGGVCRCTVATDVQ